MPDSILFWNDVALEANRISHTRDPKEQAGPTLSSRALAIVHLAMHDAYFGVETAAGYVPYTPATDLPAVPGGASAQAAVAGAAQATLSALFPSQRGLFDAKLAEFGGSADPGTRFGRDVAAVILEDRKDDPGAGDLGYGPSLARGRHREDPDNPGQGFHAPFYGARSRLFAATQRHKLEPPPFDDGEYVEALREVRGRGILPELTGTLPDQIVARTVDETLIGVYWGYDGSVGLGTPPRLYNQIVRRAAEARGNTEARNARLFALVNVAMGDAGILAWDQKYCHDLWRPVVGIREHDTSLGPVGDADNEISNDADVGWLPLGAPATNAVNPAVPGRMSVTPMMPVVSPSNVPMRAPRNVTPNFPAYPSGHATFGAAAFHIARLFYGSAEGGAAPGNRGRDNLAEGLFFVSDEHDGVNQDVRGTVRPRHRRNFPDGLWQMIIENGRSRVFLGVHWVFDAFTVDEDGEPNLNRNIGGVPLGLTIAEDIYGSGLTRSGVGPRTTGCPGPESRSAAKGRAGVEKRTAKRKGKRS